MTAGLGIVFIITALCLLALLPPRRTPKVLCDRELSGKQQTTHLRPGAGRPGFRNPPPPQVIK